MVFTPLQPKITQRESSGIFLSSTFKLPRLVGVPLYASVVARVSLVVADEIVGETQPRTVSVGRSVEGEIKETLWQPLQLV